MSSIPTSNEQPAEQSNRRASPRQRLRELVYVDLGQNNGGMLVNISEGGINFQGIQPLAQDQVLEIEFMLPGIGVPIEAKGEVKWVGGAGTCGGMRFVDLPSETLRHITHWLSLCAFGLSEEEASPRPRSLEPMPLEPPAALRVISRQVASHGGNPVPAPDASQDLALAPPLRAGHSAHSLAVPARSAPLTERTSHSGGEQAIVVESAPVRVRPRNVASAALEGQVAEQPAPARAARKLPLTFLVASGCFVLLGIIALLLFLNTDFGRGRSPAGAAAQLQADAPAQVAAQQPPATAPAQSFQIEVVEANNKRWALDEGGSAAAPKSKPPLPRSGANIPAVAAKKSPPSPVRWALGVPQPVVPTGRPSAAENVAAPGPGVPGVLTGTASSASLIAPRAAAPNPPDSLASQQTPLSQNHPAELIKQVAPVYSVQARRMRLEGKVQVSALIGRDGIPRNIKVVSGDGILGQLAVEAIRQWRYKPALLNGGPVEQPILVTANFQPPQ